MMPRNNRRRWPPPSAFLPPDTSFPSRFPLPRRPTPHTLQPIAHGASYLSIQATQFPWAQEFSSPVILHPKIMWRRSLPPPIPLPPVHFLPFHLPNARAQRGPKLRPRIRGADYLKPHDSQDSRARESRPTISISPDSSLAFHSFISPPRVPTLQAGHHGTRSLNSHGA